jgi:hypothetical protein
MPANTLPPFAAELFQPVTALDPVTYRDQSFEDIIEGYGRAFDRAVGVRDGLVSREFAVGEAAVALTSVRSDIPQRTMYLVGQVEVPGVISPVSGFIQLKQCDQPRDTFVRYGFTWPPEVAKALYGREEAGDSRDLPKSIVATIAEKQAFHMAGRFLELSVAAPA